MTKRTAFLNTLLFSALVATLLAVLWIHQGIESLLLSRTAQITTSLVLRPGTTARQAYDLAEQIQRDQGVGVTVLTEADARAQLSLQESWMANLPEVEIARLPLIIQVQHTDALQLPDAVISRNDVLKQFPEVEFIIFSDHDFEGLASAVSNIDWYSKKARNWLLGVIGLTLLLYAYVSSRTQRLSRGARLARYILTGILGSIVSLVIFHVLMRVAASHYPLPRLPVSQRLLFVAGAFAIWISASVLTPSPAKPVR